MSAAEQREGWCRPYSKYSSFSSEWGEGIILSRKGGIDIIIKVRGLEYFIHDFVHHIGFVILISLSMTDKESFDTNWNWMVYHLIIHELLNPTTETREFQLKSLVKFIFLEA